MGGLSRVFLCFTFGSDKECYWLVIQRSIYGQSRLLCRPGGTLVRDGRDLEPTPCRPPGGSSFGL